jgi:hypothetical protein
LSSTTQNDKQEFFFRQQFFGGRKHFALTKFLNANRKAKLFSFFVTVFGRQKTFGFDNGF